MDGIRLLAPLHPVIQDENDPDQVTQHGQDNDHFNFPKAIIQKSSDFPEHRGLFTLLSVKREPGIYPVYKSIKHHHKHGETKPGKNLEIPLYQEMTQVAETIEVNLFKEY